MSNRLIHEHSLYLRQHAHNPVDWYPWCDEAFEKAKAAHKPVIVSIGYAACHWCHVMERESFESEEVARYMNEHFVCIKVDREERADVDSIYMDAVTAISGSGGWPLNVFVTPDRLPFYGGTYFPPKTAYGRISWMDLLERIHDLWTKEQDAVLQQTDQMRAYLSQASKAAGVKGELAPDTTSKMAHSLLQMADHVKGGFGKAPKFPGTMAISFLLEHYHYSGDEASLKQALLSLDRMMAGGIYDQLEGGFARYSTDDDWLAPHFEKMLYDNALLILACCDAFQLTKDNAYSTVIEETIAFVSRELRDPAGGFYSALDADSEGEEGRFYTFTPAEWMELCGDLPLAGKYFGILEEGNWEGTNILHLAESMEKISEAENVSLPAVAEEVSQARKRLREARQRRERPATDDKVLLSWNALMNLALTRAGVALENEKYLQTAKEHMDWLLHNMRDGSSLYHVWRNGEMRIEAQLEDHAYLIQALIQLGVATGVNDYVAEAGSLLRSAIEFFGDEESGFFFFTGKDQSDIPVRKTELHDGATPSSNAVMAHNLFLLGMTEGRPDWSGRAKTMLESMSGAAARYTYSFSYWALLTGRFLQGWQTVIIKDEDVILQRRLKGIFLPHVLCLCADDSGKLPLLAGKSQTDKKIFVCTETECMPPVNTFEEALELINGSETIDRQKP